jgi:hypothetical protein
METVEINKDTKDKSSLNDSNTSDTLALNRSPSKTKPLGLSRQASRRRDASDPTSLAAAESDATAVSRAASSVLVSGMNLTRDLSRSIRSQLPAEVVGEERTNPDEKYARRLAAKWKRCDVFY